VNAARTAGVCLVLAGIALAEPAFRIGTKLTWRSDAGGSLWGLSPVPEAGTLVSYGEEFVGPTVEALYGPAWDFLTGRLDLVQVAFLNPGGVAFRMFPTLGLDLMVEPPYDWRVKPYLWAGARLTAYSGLPEDGWRPVYQHDSETHWRAGIGARYRLTCRIDLFAETQWFSHDSWWDGVHELPNGSWAASTSERQVIGLVGAEIGARFALGK